MKKILIVFGTRPEAIKMAPLIKKLQQEPQTHVTICVTGQHSELLDQVLDFFSITPHFNLKVMENKPSLTSVYALILQKIEVIISELQPHLILVHGDTATTAAASMAAFLHKTEVGHIEAGLRTGDITQPWPEEFNRRLVSLVTQQHFAPTTTAKENLLREGVSKNNVFVTGNTVIDALFYTLDLLEKNQDFVSNFFKKYPFLKEDKKTILVTMHRRENFGNGVLAICEALQEIANDFSDVQIVFPVHLNPNIKKPVTDILMNQKNIFLLNPLDYNEFVYMMQKSYLIITDSGGVQEEAPSLGKPVLVTRTTTERPEAVEAETVRLVGTDKERLKYWVHKLLTDKELYLQTSQTINPYGDGKACERIVSQIMGRAEKTPAHWIQKFLENLRKPKTVLDGGFKDMLPASESSFKSPKEPYV